MKTLITLIAILGFGAAGFAGKGDNVLTRKINSKIHYPNSEAGKIDAIVTVSLTVNQDGTLQINNITSTDERVVASIKHQLTQITLKPGSEQAGKTYNYRFVLKVQH